MKPSLYLIPVTLGECNVDSVIPMAVKEKVSKIECFIVENIKSARHFLKKINHPGPMDELEFHILDEHTVYGDLDEMLVPLMEGKDIALMSEAGVPAVADPGAQLIEKVHRLDHRIIPLVGPSSILLALMASGLNGQNFAFNGYLPVKKPERIRRIKQLESRSGEEDQTQIFMETPYRNRSLLDDLIRHCKPGTFLCIAANLTLDNEFIKTRKIHEWRKQIPDIHKFPAIFLLYSSTRLL